MIRHAPNPNSIPKPKLTKPKPFGFGACLIITQPIIEVPTKRLLYLKKLSGNLCVSPSTKIYSKILQKVIDRVLFTKSLNNDACSTCISLAQPTPATILVFGLRACEHALVWKLSQRRNFKSYDQLNPKQFMIKYQIPKLDWAHCLTQDEGEHLLNK